MLAPMVSDAVAKGDTLICRGGLGFVFWLRLSEHLWFVPYIAVVPRRGATAHGCFSTSWLPQIPNAVS
jgi:hypothetical protein